MEAKSHVSFLEAAGFFCKRGVVSKVLLGNPDLGEVDNIYSFATFFAIKTSSKNMAVYEVFQASLEHLGHQTSTRYGELYWESDGFWTTSFTAK